MTSEIYKHAKRDIPKTQVAELLRDFRIDEEEGMLGDPRLEDKSSNLDKRQKADALAKLKLEQK